jgi:hypothetical protein
MKRICKRSCLVAIATCCACAAQQETDLLARDGDAVAGNEIWHCTTSIGAPPDRVSMALQDRAMLGLGRTLSEARAACYGSDTGEICRKANAVVEAARDVTAAYGVCSGLEAVETICWLTDSLEDAVKSITPPDGFHPFKRCACAIRSLWVKPKILRQVKVMAQLASDLTHASTRTSTRHTYSW